MTSGARVALVLLCLAFAGAAIAIRAQSTSTPEGAQALHVDFDGPDRLLTNEHQPAAAGWEVTSGSLFVKDGAGWTGVPDRGEPDGEPRGTTNSAVFRMRTTSNDLTDADVRFRFRIVRFVDDRTTQDYDGVHVLVRYADPEDFYSVAVARRDGVAVVKRKLAGEYQDIVTHNRRPPDGRWHDARVLVADTDDGTRLRLWIDGDKVLDETDESSDGLEGGRVGIRTDNAEVLIDDLAVTAVPA